MNDNTPTHLTVRRIADIPIQDTQKRWLIKDLWALEAVGIIGGAPKCCKSWLGLDLAISVASKTPCLGFFPVQHSGAALVYLAEDASPMVRQRVLGICNHRKIDIHSLELNIIDSPSLRLDLESDRARLTDAIERLNPKLLLLDPLVRLHRADENSSADISALLGFLRELQRQFNMAVVLVHHMSKKHRTQLGQALRGSGDLHAFGDCNAYLVRKDKKLLLSLEHRFAPTSEPMKLDLVSDINGLNTHLQLADDSIQSQQNLPLEEAVRLTLANSDEPLTRSALRNILHVNNQRLGIVLSDLENNRTISRGPNGWSLISGPIINNDNNDPSQLALL